MILAQSLAHIPPLLPVMGKFIIFRKLTKIADLDDGAGWAEGGEGSLCLRVCPRSTILSVFQGRLPSAGDPEEPL